MQTHHFLPKGRRTRTFMAVLLYLFTLFPAHASIAQEAAAPSSDAIDLMTDADDDGVPDALAAEIARFSALADVPADADAVQAAAMDTAFADFAARLPFSAETRAAQADGASIMRRMSEAASPEETAALEAQLRDIEARMAADPDFVLATEAIRTLFVRQLRAKAEADGAQFITVSVDTGVEASAANATWPDSVGDIMFINSNSSSPNFLYAMAFSHIGTFDEDDQIYDSNKGDGVRTQDLSGSNWVEDKSLIAYAYNNQKSANDVQSALQWAKNRYGDDGRTGYNLLMTRDKNDDSNPYGSGFRVYCSQLVWKIHQHISSNVDSDHPTIRAFLQAYWGSIGRDVAANGVAPDEIAMDSNITFYKWISPQGHEEPKVYIPDVRLQHNNWKTRVVVRNDGSQNATVRVVTADSEGVILNTVVNEALRPNASWIVNMEAGGLHGSNISDRYGSAMVFADQDVSAIAYQSVSGVQSNASYAGVESPNGTVHVPLVQRGNSGTYNYISIQNTDLNAGANVTLRFTPGLAGNSCTKSYTLPARGHVLLNTADGQFSCLGSKFIGPVKITADKQLAVAYTQYSSGGDTLLASSSAAGNAGTLYAPVIQHWNSGWTSGFSLLNTSSSSGSPAVDYYDTGHCSNQSYNLGGERATVIFPAPPPGSGCSTVLSGKFSGNGRQVGAQVNQIKAGETHGSDYPAIAQPSTTVVAPILWRGWTGRDSGLAIQNTSSSTANITITYYNASNGSHKTSESKTIGGNQSIAVFPIKPSYFQGSAVITSDRSIAVVVNHIIGDAQRDNLMTHIGLVR